MTHCFVAKIIPVPKPRMTRADTWKKRPAVLRYRAFCDAICAVAKQKKFELPDSDMWIIFYLPMPESWSEKRKIAMERKPHQQKPDVDNMLKAVCDALREKDEGIWDVRASKFWARQGSIHIVYEERCLA